MGQKRVKFNQKQDRVYEFEVQSSETDEEQNLNKKENDSDDSDSVQSGEFSDEEICGSDDEDMEKGTFFDYIEGERKR